MYKFNDKADYKVGPYWNKKSIDLDQLIIFVTTDVSFNAKMPALFSDYLLPKITNDNLVRLWGSHPIQFYQNQLNFAVYCATTGCGVSYVNHLNHLDPLTRSVYNFHAYYQIRRILSELQIPLPYNKSFDPVNNPINMKAFERICNEFNISKQNTQVFRQVSDRNHGLGTIYYPYTHRVYNYDYWPGHTGFSDRSAIRIGSIEQQHHDAWNTFILDKGKGFTQPGIERLNDSIRTYVWCLLSCQSQTRSNVVKSGTRFDAQKQFLANLEDAINSPVDLPGSIARYQSTLKYARSKVDYAVGYGLYMLPSDLQLLVGTRANYNNEIVIAGENQKLGLNDDINTKLVGHFVLKGAPKPKPFITDTLADDNDDNDTPPIPPSVVTSDDDHESQKTALSVGLISVGLLLLYLRKK